MNKNLLSRKLHERVGGLRSSGVYFFRGDFEFILQGIVLEYVPRGLYVWSLLFPLFDFFGPNLTYSSRLPRRAFFAKGEVSEDDIVDLVLASPDVRHAFDPASSPMTVAGFVHHLLGSNLLLNPHVQLMHAASLVLLGKDSEAASMLEKLPSILHPKDIPHCKQLKESLMQGHEAARILLASVREGNLKMLGAE